MLYAILIYGSEAHCAQWSPQEERDVMGRHAGLRQDLTAAGRLGPVMRLSPQGARIVRKYKDRRFITDGPFAETKEQLMGSTSSTARPLTRCWRPSTGWTSGRACSRSARRPTCIRASCRR
jgi:hypothetical protein